MSTVAQEGVVAGKRQLKSRELMRSDARLPEDIQAPELEQDAPTRVLVTGATGFLGRHVLKALLRDTELSLVCLVRDGQELNASQRLLAAMSELEIDSPENLARITVIGGDIALPRFGLADKIYDDLSKDVGRVYHCAAHVNWARNYRQLREINVNGSLEVIRFACEKRCKPVVFVSTIAVCFAFEHSGAVTEETDMLPHIERMPLGYAQSKCVAESLLRQACKRGLPVTILRPSLISGDSQSGKANTDDLIAALIEGCARAGVCGDSDWLLDCVPVDMVADVVARMPMASPDSTNVQTHDSAFASAQPATDDQAAQGLPVTLHLVHDKPCHWSDAIACLNGFGCPVKLVSINDWVSIVFANRESAGQRLYGYRRFFAGFGAAAALPAPFETYLQRHQERVQSAFSYRVLEGLGINIPALDQNLLFRYLEFYDRNGLLPGRVQ